MLNSHEVKSTKEQKKEVTRSCWLIPMTGSWSQQRLDRIESAKLSRIPLVLCYFFWQNRGIKSYSFVLVFHLLPFFPPSFPVHLKTLRGNEGAFWVPWERSSKWAKEACLAIMAMERTWLPGSLVSIPSRFNLSLSLYLVINSQSPFDALLFYLVFWNLHFQW